MGRADTGRLEERWALRLIALSEFHLYFLFLWPRPLSVLSSRRPLDSLFCVFSVCGILKRIFLLST